MKTYPILLFLLVLLLVSGCLSQKTELTNTTESSSGTVEPETSFITYPSTNSSMITGPFFCPEDNCRQAVIDQLSKANSSIVVAMYSFTDSSVADTLIKKHQEGVKVQVLVDAGQISKYSMVRKLSEAGIPVREDSNSAYMHNKFVVIDQRIVLTGSVNYTGNGFGENNENLIVVDSRDIAADYYLQFLRLWNKGIDWVGG